MSAIADKARIRKQKLLALREMLDFRNGEINESYFDREKDLYDRAILKRALDVRISKCRLCPNMNIKGLTECAFGWGNLNASLMIIGQSLHKPGVQSGIPFIFGCGYYIDAALRLSGLSRYDIFITNTLHCLRYDTLVILADGTKKRISEIGNNKLKCEVLSVTEEPENRLVAKKVIGWHKTKLNGRRTYKIYFKHSKRAGLNGFSGVKLTENHQILTLVGWKTPIEINQYDYIATGTPALEGEQEDLLYGMLIGDGHIAQRHIQISHCAKQKEYLVLKARLLSIFGGCKIKQYSVNSSTTQDKPYKRVSFTTYSQPYISYLRERLYNGKKKSLKWILKKYGKRETLPLAFLAAWYMDDGHLQERANRSPRAEISAADFPLKDVRKLAKKIGFKVSVVCYNYGPRIIFSTESTKQFSSYISKYVPQSMRYKLCPEDRKNSFSEKIYHPNSVTFWDNVIVKPYVETIKCNHSYYCIDVVTTHNFVTTGGVVHNCHPDSNRPSELKEIRNCLTFLRQEIDIIHPSVILAMGNDAQLALNIIFNPSTHSLQKSVMLRHPASIMRSSPEQRIDYILKLSGIFDKWKMK